MRHKIHHDDHSCARSNKHNTIKPWGVDQTSIVPYPHSALPWMTLVRKELLYDSGVHKFEQRVGNLLQKRGAYFPEGYYANRLYETVIGKLLHDYLTKINPHITVSIASNYDDMFAGCDYIISQGDQCVRVDLSVANTSDHNLNKYHIPAAIIDKTEKFFRTSYVPEEYFLALKPDIEPRPLPLVIICVDRFILSSFIHDFFEIIATQKTDIDLLEYFSEWMNTESYVTKDRVAYLLGYVNDPKESGFVNDITNQIGILLAGMKGVSTTVQ